MDKLILYEVEVDGVPMLVSETLDLGPIPEYLQDVLESKPKTFFQKLFPFL